VRKEAAAGGDVEVDAEEAEALVLDAEVFDREPDFGGHDDEAPKKP
jgi:membrane-associated protein